MNIAEAVKEQGSSVLNQTLSAISQAGSLISGASSLINQNNADQFDDPGSSVNPTGPLYDDYWGPGETGNGNLNGDSYTYNQDEYNYETVSNSDSSETIDGSSYGGERLSMSPASLSGSAE